MGQNHLLRLAVPRTWKLNRKEHKYIARPTPGPHAIEASLTLNFLLREVLQYTKTTKEIKRVLTNGEVIVDGVVRKEMKFPVGFMDTLQLPKLEESYRMVYQKDGSLVLKTIKKDEAHSKLLKIIRKTMVPGGKLQLTFHDGRNILADKFEGNVDDTVLFDLKNKKAGKVFNMKEGSLIYLTGGSHIGSLGKIKGIIKGSDLQQAKVVVDIDGTEYITLVKYAFVVGKDKSELDLGVKK
jgi:small subunit ribosomal protein S4e